MTRGPSLRLMLEALAGAVIVALVAACALLATRSPATREEPLTYAAAEASIRDSIEGNGFTLRYLKVNSLDGNDANVTISVDYYLPTKEHRLVTFARHWDVVHVEPLPTKRAESPPGPG